MHKLMIAAAAAALVPGLAIAQTGMSGTSGTTGQSTMSGTGTSAGTMPPMGSTANRTPPVSGQRPDTATGTRAPRTLPGAPTVTPRPGTLGGTMGPGTVTTGTGVSDGINGGTGTTATDPATTTNPETLPPR